MQSLISAEEASKNAKKINGEIEIIIERQLNQISKLISAESKNGGKYIELYVPDDTFDSLQDKLREAGYYISRPVIAGIKKDQTELGIKWY